MSRVKLGWDWSGWRGAASKHSTCGLAAQSELVTRCSITLILFTVPASSTSPSVEPGETSDSFVVSGRGTLHLGILIENMRREGYEFEIGPPKVITREVDGKTCEPYEEAIVDVSGAGARGQRAGGLHGRGAVHAARLPVSWWDSV